MKITAAGRSAAWATALCLCLSLLPGCHSPGGSPAASSGSGGRQSAPGLALKSELLPPPLIAWKPRAALFERARHVKTEVALTFDAGATADAVPLLLKTLAGHHVHATFFLTGKFCEHFPAACRAIAEAGMEIGNHSYSHPHFTKLSRTAIVRQLNRAEEAIVKACGRGAKPLFRFPYGDCDRRTCEIVAQAGYQPVGWTLDSLDSVGKPKSADFVANRIISKIRPGYITLMHVSLIRSAEALPRIFDRLDRLDTQVVPVSQLLIDSTLTTDNSRRTARR